MNTTPARRWWIPAILSFVVAGLGQLYNGRRMRAAVFYGIPLVTTLFMALAAQRGWMTLAIALTLAGVFARGVSIVEAARDARRVDSPPGPFTRPAAYIGAGIATFAVAMTFSMWLRQTQVQAYRVPAPAMAHTFEIGDYFFADKRAHAKPPAPGEIIVYRDPRLTERTFVKRVVAVAGQTIEIRDRALYIDHRLQQEPYVLHTDPNVTPASEGPRDNFGPFVIPAGAVFVLGDNRENSNDSRYWGPLPLTLVDGRARGIYWSWDPVRSTPRWDRIGRLPR